MAATDPPARNAASGISTFYSTLHERRRLTVLMTSGNLVITVLKSSRKDANNQPLRAGRQAGMAAVMGGRLQYFYQSCKSIGHVQNAFV